MQFYFIRHGQSANNRRWDLTGSDNGRSEDPEMTETGHLQAQALAAYLRQSQGNAPLDEKDWLNRKGVGLTHIYTSLHLRAVTTAAPMAQALGLRLVAWPDWHEHGGIYRLNESTGELQGKPGKNRAYFEAHFPDMVLPEGLGEQGWWNRPRETEEEHLPRARRVLAELLEKHGGRADHVAVVSHGGFYNDFLAVVMGLKRSPQVWFNMNNMAISRVDFLDHRFDIIYHNRVDFLPDELVS
jgi:2,3-bisphosphoglycerate-dependent phosphoglycerate mutase